MYVRADVSVEITSRAVKHQSTIDIIDGHVCAFVIRNDSATTISRIFQIGSASHQNHHARLSAAPERMPLRKTLRIHANVAAAAAADDVFNIFHRADFFFQTNVTRSVIKSQSVYGVGFNI